MESTFLEWHNPQKVHFKDIMVTSHNPKITEYTKQGHSFYCIFSNHRQVSEILQPWTGPQFFSLKTGEDPTANIVALQLFSSTH